MVNIKSIKTEQKNKKSLKLNECLPLKDPTLFVKTSNIEKFKILM